MSEILSVKQRRAVQALAGGASIQGAAEAAGVSERTLYRWRGQPLFVQALRQADADAIGEVARTLNAASHRAVAYLIGVLYNKDLSAGLRMRAASEILRYRAAFYDLTSVSDRLDALEGRVFGGTHEDEPAA